mmetsp:Transcript_48978/g.74500  ORF Transcript_48978/g.74500 Transcript_48978/m.74500 type:complete len:252 (+) Transcript_48978:393-1148(+)
MVIASLHRALGDSRESVQVQLPLQGLVLGLLEEQGHDLLHKRVNLVDLEGAAIHLPRSNVFQAFAFHVVEHIVKLVWEDGGTLVLFATIPVLILFLIRLLLRNCLLVRVQVAIEHALERVARSCRSFDHAALLQVVLGVGRTCYIRLEVAFEGVHHHTSAGSGGGGFAGLVDRIGFHRQGGRQPRWRQVDTFVIRNLLASNLLTLRSIVSGKVFVDVTSLIGAAGHACKAVQVELALERLVLRLVEVLWHD